MRDAIFLTNVVTYWFQIPFSFSPLFLVLLYCQEQMQEYKKEKVRFLNLKSTEKYNYVFLTGNFFFFCPRWDLNLEPPINPIPSQASWATKKDNFIFQFLNSCSSCYC